MNLFLYVKNKPINSRDPSGLGEKVITPEGCCCAAVYSSKAYGFDRFDHLCIEAKTYKDGAKATCTTWAIELLRAKEPTRPDETYRAGKGSSIVTPWSASVQSELLEPAQWGIWVYPNKRCNAFEAKNKPHSYSRLRAQPGFGYETIPCWFTKCLVDRAWQIGKIAESNDSLYSIDVNSNSFIYELMIACSAQLVVVPDAPGINPLGAINISRNFGWGNRFSGAKNLYRRPTEQEIRAHDALGWRPKR